MAITKLGALVVGIRGTVGGVTMSENRSSTYAKLWSRPVRRNTPAQLQQRGFMSFLGREWRTLSTAEQDDWATFAATPPETDYNSLGEIYLLSGFGWFSRIYLRRLRTGQVPDLLAPAAVVVNPPATFDMTLYPSTGDPADAVFSYTDGDFTDIYAILQMSLSPGLGTNKQTSRYLNLWEAAVLTSTETEFGEEYQTSFGKTQIGQRYFARLYRQSVDAIRSTPLELFVDVEAAP